MITFFVCLTALIAAYFTYGTIVNRVIGTDTTRDTPAIRLNDGVDYVPLPTLRVLLIQFINIAGTGPIFGAISGALFGPIAFLWITFGCIFIGGVHDLLSGIISIRHDGATVAEMIGLYLGTKVKAVMRVFSVVLLILVGVVFVLAPAGLLANLTNISIPVWTFVIFIYYILATILPIDKIMGRFYPVFGAALILMGVSLLISMLFSHLNGNVQMMELTLNNLHPNMLPAIPFLFVTIACGAVSGFHATQSPVMARCIKSESKAKQVFYGAMIIEGMIALIWCAVAIAFFGDTFVLGNALSDLGGPSGVVNEVSIGLLGPTGFLLAILGVVAAPISSGDTAFRVARLTIADIFNINQAKTLKRFLVAVPLFVIGGILTFIDFDILWRYFAWSNQTLAMVFLWTGAVFLVKNKRNYWIAALPAAFMTFVSVSYITQAPEGFGLPALFGNVMGMITAIALLGLFLIKARKIKTDLETE